MEPISSFTLGKNSLGLYLEAEEEDLLMVKVEWFINQVRFNLTPQQFHWEKPWFHSAQLAATTATLESQMRVKLITGWPKSAKLPLLSDSFSMKILMWNCRGAGNDSFKANFRDIFNDNNPEIVAILETKVPLSNMGFFFNQFDLTESINIDPNGRAGGIWMLWNPKLVNLKLYHASSQVIHAIITRNNYEEWLLSAVYASPNNRVRDQLWANLAMVAEHYSYPWLLAGDFNDHGGSNEKRSFSRSQDQRRVQKFQDNINNCNLVDLGSSGPRLTWSNSREGLANTLVRLDRALANPDWRIKFPEATVANLPRTYSDHCPILISTEGTIKINTDGSVLSCAVGSYGGLVRSDQGKWIEGFCGKIGPASVMKAELWGIRQALRLIKEKGWHGAPIESDCLNAIDLINSDEDVENHPERFLIEECRNTKREMECPIRHIPREANKCADKIAKLGGRQREQHVKLLVPPSEVIEDLIADIQGVEAIGAM